MVAFRCRQGLHSGMKEYLSAAELLRLYELRRLSPVEVVDETLRRIERSQPVLNAFITICAGRALDEAKRAEAAIRSGETTGPLHGVPFSVKDLVNTGGVRTTFGSFGFAENVP